MTDMENNSIDESGLSCVFHCLILIIVSPCETTAKDPSDGDFAI